MRRIQIPIPFAKSGRPPVYLNYVQRPLTNTQVRLAGREVLLPQVALKSFRRQAVIDWIDITFSLPRPSQAFHLKTLIDGALRTNVHVTHKPKDEDEARAQTGTDFTVRLQEPSVTEVIACQDAVLRARQLELPGVIVGMEVSVDFYPEHPPAADDRTRLFGVLQRHLWPAEDVLTSQRGRPRFSWGSGEAKTRHVLPLGKSETTNRELLYTTERDRLAYGDSTYYVGSRDGLLMWRIMDKEVDQQNRATGTRRDLSAEERRVRIEVTLRGEELEKLGLRTTGDLSGFKFEKLRSRYFDFMLPTFRGRGRGLKSLVAEWLEKERRTKFMTAGVIGLKAMDEIALEKRRARRSELVRHLKQAGRTITPEARRGRGAVLTFVAYEELNKAVETALRHLSEREGRGLGL